MYYGSIAFVNCDAQKQYKVNVFTKLADEDKKLYFEFDEASFPFFPLPKNPSTHFPSSLEQYHAEINPIYLNSPHTTQCEHSYPTANPDDRLTLAVQLCEPFTEEQVKLIPKADAILLNTLYKGIHFFSTTLYLYLILFYFFLNDQWNFLQIFLPRYFSFPFLYHF